MYTGLIALVMGTALCTSAHAMGRRPSANLGRSLTPGDCRAQVLQALGQDGDSHVAFRAQWSGHHVQGLRPCELELTMSEIPQQPLVLGVRFLSDPEVWPFSGVLLSGSHRDSIMETTHWSCSAHVNVVRIDHHYAQSTGSRVSNHVRSLTLEQTPSGYMYVSFANEDDHLSCLLKRSTVSPAD